MIRQVTKNAIESGEKNVIYYTSANTGRSIMFASRSFLRILETTTIQRIQCR